VVAKLVAGDVPVSTSSEPIEHIDPCAPFTNPDDKLFERWLEKWKRGEKLTIEDYPEERFPRTPRE
jgi:hypothetical protein